MSEMWKKAPENPKNSGGATTKKSKVPKATASSSPASSSQPTVDDTKENDVPSSDVEYVFIFYSPIHAYTDFALTFSIDIA